MLTVCFYCVTKKAIKKSSLSWTQLFMDLLFLTLAAKLSFQFLPALNTGALEAGILIFCFVLG